MKSLQVLVILLLFSFILFILFHLERVESKVSKEGMVGISDEVPRCQTGEHEDIPACYATLQQEDYLNYISDFTNEDYLLKTKIVTPVCPNDPYDSKTSDITKPEERIITSPDNRSMINSEIINRNYTNQPNTNQSTGSNQRDASNNNTSNNSLPSTFNLLQYNEANQPAPANQSTSSNDASIKLPSLPSLSTNNTVSTPEKPKEPEPANPSDCKATPDKASAFPPCPACERCPEPVVDCKKVIHYKDKQYPAPVEEVIFTRF